MYSRLDKIISHRCNYCSMATVGAIHMLLSFLVKTKTISTKAGLDTAMKLSNKMASVQRYHHNCDCGG